MPAGNETVSDASILRFGDQPIVPPDKAGAEAPLRNAHEAPVPMDPVRPEASPFLSTPEGVTLVQPSIGLAIMVTVVGPGAGLPRSGGEKLMRRLPTAHGEGPVRVCCRSVRG